MLEPDDVSAKLKALFRYDAAWTVDALVQRIGSVLDCKLAKLFTRHGPVEHRRCHSCGP